MKYSKWPSKNLNVVVMATMFKDIRTYSIVIVNRLPINLQVCVRISESMRALNENYRLTQYMVCTNLVQIDCVCFSLLLYWRKPDTLGPRL